ncbi:hypothetical protein ASG43_09490 [Aureimonas sp. Leaf454]|uniref:cytochrome b n=1 Tax=Aureimonas sp. Leaf454 TaxID=1736381 RepID=UPI0006F1F1E8|nr:cytochrome b [Aureimonas sp. Leaf454]KQT47353.1 hypothetical protein ASG43_09490 [Aureimonas sp. Leaf454]
MSVMSKHPLSQRDGVPPLPKTIRVLHWATAGLLVVLFALAWSFEGIGPSDLGVTLVDLHRSFGLLLFLVVVARLAWRATHRIDPMPEASPRWERFLASAVQSALLLCLVAMPILGWVASALSGETIRAFGFPLPDLLAMNEDRSDGFFELHEAVAWVLIVLVALHVAGALRHHFVKRDGLIGRMRIW